MIEPIETNGGLLLPDGRLIKPRLEEDLDGTQRVPGMLTRAEARRFDALMKAKYFIFRNDGGQYGERMICKAQNPDGTWRGCGLIHSHITFMCVELPFRGGQGLEEGFYLSFRAATDRAKQSAILKTISKLPDLARGHPLTARDMLPDDDGENWLAVLISLPEPISREQALKFQDRINSRHPAIPFDIGPAW